MSAVATYCRRCGLDKIFLDSDGLCDECAWEAKETGGGASWNGQVDRVPASPTHSLADVHDAFSSALYLPEMAVVDVALATVLANRGGGDPVWVMLIAPPSSGKTEVLRALGGLPEAHGVSTLTAQTFASGMKGNARASLLHRLEPGPQDAADPQGLHQRVDDAP